MQRSIRTLEDIRELLEFTVWDENELNRVLLASVIEGFMSQDLFLDYLALTQAAVGASLDNFIDNFIDNFTEE